MTFDELSPEQQQRICDEWYALAEVKDKVLFVYTNAHSNKAGINLFTHWREFCDAAVARHVETVVVPVDKLVANIKQLEELRKQ